MGMHLGYKRFERIKKRIKTKKYFFILSLKQNFTQRFDIFSNQNF